MDSLDYAIMELLYQALQINDCGLRPALNGQLYSRTEFWDYYGPEQASAYWTAAGLQVAAPVLVISGSAEDPGPGVHALVQKFHYPVAINQEVLIPDGPLRRTSVITTGGAHPLAPRLADAIISMGIRDGVLNCWKCETAAANGAKGAHASVHDAGPPHYYEGGLQCRCEPRPPPRD